MAKKNRESRDQKICGFLVWRKSANLFILLTEFYDRTATRTINGRLPANSWVVVAPSVSVVPTSIRTGILPAVVVGLPTVAGFPFFVSKVLDLAGNHAIHAIDGAVAVSLCCLYTFKIIL